MAIITGTPNNDILVGTNEADTIRGLEGNDIISGLDGADQLDGGAGNDSIAGNLGNDSIFGGAGDDTLLGGQGDDLIIGEAGNDIIAGEAGTNTLTGGVGRDTFILTTRGKATITDFFAGDDLLGLSSDLTIDDIEVVQRFANTEVIDRRTGNVLASLTNVNAGDLRRQNFVDENGRPVNFNPAPATLVDVIATDGIAQATNPDDPIVFTVSRTNTVGDLTVNFTLSTTAGVTLQNPPTSVRIPAGQQFANVLVRPQNNSGNGTVTITLQDTPNYDVRTGTATGTVSAPIPAPTPAPAPAVPDAPPVVDLVLTRADIPATPSAGQPVTTTFNVFNRGTGKADRVELSANLPIDTRLVSVEPSQGVFTNFSGDSTRGGIVKVELGSIDPDRGAKVVVTYVPNTTGNFVLTDARVTSAQPDVNPSNNFANAGFTIIPSPPVLPVISVVATGDGVAREPDTTQLEGTDRETETGLVTQQFIISRRGGDLTRPLTVSYTLEGTAQNGVDFNPIGSSVTFAPFQTEVVVTIRPVQDRQVEGTEFVRLNLVPNPLVYNVNEPEGRSSARIEIVDVPNPVGPAPLPGTVVSLVAIDNFADEFRPPSSSGQSTPGSVSPIRGVLRVTRDNTIGDLTVNVEVSGFANRPDEPNSDYILFDTLGRIIPVVGGIARITIPDGQQFIDVYLEAIDDALEEGDEDALFNLAPGVGYVIGRPQDIAADRPAEIIIRDNEPPGVQVLRLTPTVPTAIEGGTNAVLTLTRSGSTERPLPVTLTTLTAEFRIQPLVIQDGQLLPTQQVFNQQILPALPLPPVLTIQAGNQFEDINLGQVIIRTTLVGTVNEIPISVQLRLGRSGDPSLPLTVTRTLVNQIATIGGTAVLGTDYDLPDNILIPAGQSTLNIPIEALVDGVVEGTESFAVIAGTGSDYRVIGQPVVFTIQDADARGTITIEPTVVSTTEGSPNPATVTITLDADPNTPGNQPLNSPIDVPLTIGGTATNGVDYVQVPDRVTIPAGQTSVVVNVTALADNNVEGTETVSVALGAVTGFNTGSPPAVVFIQDGNALGTLTIEPTVVSTTEGSPNPAQVTITRVGGNPQIPLTVPLVIGGTATNGQDYIQIPNSVVIPPNQNQVVININALIDPTVEGDETVSIALGNVPGFNIGSPPAQVTIFDINPVAQNITGTANPDILQGFAGNDNISGGGGNDTIIGSFGNDTTQGDAGADNFVFFVNEAFLAGNNAALNAVRAAASADTILDFNVAQGDRIILEIGFPLAPGAASPGEGSIAVRAANNVINAFVNVNPGFSAFLDNGVNDIFGNPGIPIYSYDAVSGRFLFDPDGTSPAQPYLLIANLPPGLSDGTPAQNNALLEQFIIRT